MFPALHSSRGKFPRQILRPQPSEFSRLRATISATCGPSGISTHRLTRIAISRKLKSCQLAFVKPCRDAHLVQIVVFRRHPKDRNGIHSRLASIPAPSESRSPLCKSRTPARRTIRLAVRSRRPQHLSQNVSDSRASLRLHPARHSARRESSRLPLFARADSRATALLFSPLAIVGGVSVELLDRGKIIEELNKELRLMRQLAKRQGSTVHRGLDDTDGLSSQQI